MKIMLVITLAFCMPVASFANGLVPNDRPSSLFQMIQEKKIVEQLEIIDSQLDDIELLRRRHNREMSQRLREAIFSSNADRAKGIQAIQEVVSSIPEYEEALLNEVLLEHQIKRLKEIWRQREIQRKGVAHVLERTLSEEIRLNEKQLQQIREIDEEAEQERQRVIKELVRKKYASIIKVLDDDQREQWFVLVGNPAEE